MRGNTAIQGQFGYELDLNKLTDSEIEAVREQIKTYKRLGEIFHKGDLYRLVTPDNSNFVSNEFISEDKKKIILVNCVLRAIPNSPVYYLKLKGLEREAMYAIEGTDKVLSGELLMSSGIPYQLSCDYDSKIIELIKL